MAPRGVGDHFDVAIRVIRHGCYVRRPVVQREDGAIESGREDVKVIQRALDQQRNPARPILNKTSGEVALSLVKKIFISK